MGKYLLASSGFIEMITNSKAITITIIILIIWTIFFTVLSFIIPEEKKTDNGSKFTSARIASIVMLAGIAILTILLFVLMTIEVFNS